MTRSLGLKKPHLTKQNSHVAFPCKISLSCCASYTTLGLPVSGWTHNAFCCVKSHDGSWLRTRQTYLYAFTNCVMSCRRCPQLHPKMPRFKKYIHRTTSITRTRITRTKISFLLIKISLKVTPITRILVLVTPLERSSCSIIGKNTKTINPTAI